MDVTRNKISFLVGHLSIFLLVLFTQTAFQCDRAALEAQQRVVGQSNCQMFLCQLPGNCVIHIRCQSTCPVYSYTAERVQTVYLQLYSTHTERRLVTRWSIIIDPDISLSLSASQRHSNLCTRSFSTKLCLGLYKFACIQWRISF